MELSFPKIKILTPEEIEKERKERADKKYVTTLSTTISKRQKEDWLILCQITGKSSFSLLRWCIQSMLDNNRHSIDKFKQDNQNVG